jgi:hypothetical protein
METARIKVQGLYSLLAGLVLLVGVPLYQAVVLGADYRAPSNAAFNQANYAPLLDWISANGSAFTVFRILELLTFLLALRVPFALYRVFRGYGSTLARWMLVGGLGGLVIFVAMVVLSTISFINAAGSFGALAPTSAAARDVVSSFGGLYGVEELAQNTLGGALLAIFTLCASLLFARSGKMQGLLVYFGLLVAALLAGLALLFAVSPQEGQTQLATPALASFAAWLIWLGILLMSRAPRLVASSAPTVVTSPPAEERSAAQALAGDAATPADAPEQASALSPSASTPTSEPPASSPDAAAPQASGA